MKAYKKAIAIILSFLLIMSVGAVLAAAAEIAVSESEYTYERTITKDEIPTDDTMPTMTTAATAVNTESTEITTGDATQQTEPTEEATFATDSTENTDTQPIQSTPVETSVTEPQEESSSSVAEDTLSTEPAESTYDEALLTNRYYFYMPEIWYQSGTAGIYWWEGSDCPEGWPGYQAKKADAEGVYYFDVPKDVSVIIWNNFIDGGADPQAEIYKLAQQTFNISCAYYEAGDSETYPNGLESFDNMIFVVDLMTSVSDISGKHTYEGEWYYYYGSGEYGLAPTKAEADRVYSDSYLTDSLTPSDDEEPSNTLPPVDFEFSIGDVNMDSKVNIKDVTMIQKYTAKLLELDDNKLILADFNADGIVNIKDATAIQKKIAGLI